MDFTDYLLWKALALIALAAVYNFWLGFTGRRPPGQSGQQTAQRPEAGAGAREHSGPK